jgi:hypothetical protein
MDQGLDQHGEDLMREVEADEKRNHQRRQAPEEPAPELNQMLKQWLLGFVDILHGSGRCSGGSSSPG